MAPVATPAIISTFLKFSVITETNAAVISFLILGYEKFSVVAINR